MWARIAYTGYLDARSLVGYVLAEGKDSAVIATDYFPSGFTTRPIQRSMFAKWKRNATPDAITRLRGARKIPSYRD